MKFCSSYGSFIVEVIGVDLRNANVGYSSIIDTIPTHFGLPPIFLRNLRQWSKVTPLALRPMDSCILKEEEGWVDGLGVWVGWMGWVGW